MTKYRAFLAGAAALAIGLALSSIDPAHAQLGTGQSAIGAGGDTIGAAPPPNEAEEAARADAARSVGTCITNRTAFRTQSNQVSTNSTTFVSMPNTHYSITHAAGCLIVDFAGETGSTFTGPQLDIRAFIPGIGAAEPAEARMGRFIAAEFFEVRSMRFVFPNVPAGTHTVRIDWRNPQGDTVLAGNRTLTIQYR